MFVIVAGRALQRAQAGFPVLEWSPGKRYCRRAIDARHLSPELA
ncbi:hypothetical protein A2U01_0042395 [Trifolium medium]|uniref:Uncharacterized protein n=1 Tax=Trifolium medium TaxID=97028 RepID=A0A392QBH7_9FABA|nr:hypothetical protein [Trifolium medium]